ncbi:DUF2345 domain-containing protein, partial [Salinicola aestuarinus]|uniref:DUF2345 domain-containing protein n=1 Tax=Salinicola aestuarinus TaxID=1949082 RepID=UPI0013002F6B
GAYVRIKGGDIELHAPGKVTVNGASQSFEGPASLDGAMPELPEGECEKQFAGADKSAAGSTPVGS